MAKFHTLTISDVRQETADCVSVAFNVPQELKNEYQFTQGQYLTLKTSINNQEVRRSYSICTSPLEGELRVAIKKVEQGVFSTYANETLKAGDSLEVMTPMGKFFTRVDPKQSKNYVLFAAGSGITPIISIVKTVLETEPNSQVTLFYGNKNSDSIIFREELEGLKNTYLTRFSLYHVLSRENLGVELFKGRIESEKCNKLLHSFVLPGTIDEAFMCGPVDMINAVRAELEQVGVAKENIHFELFTSAGSKSNLGSTQKQNNPTTNVAAEVTIVLDGDRFTFDMQDANDNILDAALKAGADLPYACKGGVCCTCRARVLEGEVDMEVNYALEPHEVEQGFVLTCQSHPKTKSVTVDFDQL